MKKSVAYLLRALASFVLITSSMSSQAALVSMDFSGTFEYTSVGFGSDLTGLAFSGTFSYDTNSALLYSNTGNASGINFGSGYLYEYDPMGVSFSIDIEGRPTEMFSYSNPFAFNVFWVRDNSEDTFGIDPFSPADGISVALGGADFDLRFILRTSNLDAVNGDSLENIDTNAFAPTELSEFRFGTRNSNGEFHISRGRFDITSVNEPSVFVVMIMGFGLMVSRRVRNLNAESQIPVQNT